MAATARQKRLYLHHQGEFQLQNCTVGTVHDSDHEGVVRIFVRCSYQSNELFILINYITRHNFSPTRSVISVSSSSSELLHFGIHATGIHKLSDSCTLTERLLLLTLAYCDIIELTHYCNWGNYYYFNIYTPSSYSYSLYSRCTTTFVHVCAMAPWAQHSQ